MIAKLGGPTCEGKAEDPAFESRPARTPADMTLVSTRVTRVVSTRVTRVRLLILVRTIARVSDRRHVSDRQRNVTLVREPTHITHVRASDAFDMFQRADTYDACQSAKTSDTCKSINHK